MSDIDVNDVVAKVTVELVKDSLKALFVPFAKSIKTTQAKFLEDFADYFETTYIKNSNIRTLFSKNKPCELLKIYVNTKFQCGDKTLDDDDLIKRVRNCERVIVNGNGGCGKTVFLRYFWLKLFSKPDGKIPIFIELRRVSDLSKVDMIAFIRAELRSKIVSDNATFLKLCEGGRFIFLFDGFDEVTREKRVDVEKQILKFSDSYPKCGFLVTGRDDDRFSGWGSFTSMQVLPFGHPEVTELIGKIHFDKRVKQNFLVVLTSEFFEEHRSFLSNPLLAIMMLMSYYENASIPTKLNTFYDQAFQTLLTWHDATKDSFDRNRCLDVDKFRRIFATFCLFSYYDQQYEFEEQKLRQLIQKSLKYHKFTESVDDVKCDFCESVNLIQKDGLKYVFVHRSFQEYFAAYCTTNIISGKTKELLSLFSERRSDDVFAMCYDIHPELVIDEYISPNFDRLVEEAFFDVEDADQRYPFLSKINIETSLYLEANGLISCSWLSDHARNDEIIFIDAVMKLIPRRDNRYLKKYLFSIFPIGIREQAHLMIGDSCFNESTKKSINNSLRNFKGSKLHVVVRLRNDNVNISVLNMGKTKVPRVKIEGIKKRIRKNLVDSFPQAEAHAKEVLEIVKNFCEDASKDRNQKGATLDDMFEL